jgi:beta-1,4-N-acetylglucosaminyltransferase
MMNLREFWRFHMREWVTHESAETESIVAAEVVHFVPRQSSRSITYTIRNFFYAFRILRQFRPDMIVSTGSAVGVSFIYAGRLLGIRTIFVESISRVRNLGLSGRLVYPVVTEFYVQWEECTKGRSKALYKGTTF